jgi:hypothetical protein
MPISITITDINNLTKTDIQELHTYLHRSWLLAPSQATKDPKVIEQELDKEVFIPNSILEKNGNIPKQFVEKFKESFGKSGKISPVIDEHDIKARKKRKTKQQKLDETYADSCYGEETVQNVINVEHLDGPTRIVPILEITYQELISYVLENTREKKISFDEVKELIAYFKVPSLNDLDKFPQLITPFYNAVKDIVNAR